MESQYHYYAFISYNHRDEKVAKWLQRQLEHYRLPAIARKEIGRDVKIRPVFRYAVNLSLGDLREKIKEELDASKYLIVVCSPNSAQPNIEGKHWVNDEITRFIETGRKDAIIPVIVDGEPNVGGERECFPPALRGAEIAGANLSKGSRSQRRADFLKIVAKLLGILPDQLIRHTEDEEQRMLRLKWLKLLPLACLAILGGLFVWDVVRPVSLYFADWVDCYGLPEGIYEVPKSDLRMRSSTYRFDYQGYYWHGIHLKSLPQGWFGLRRKLKRVVHVGPTDIPTEEYNEFLKPRPIIMKFVYDEDGRLMKKTIHKRGGKDFVSGPIIKNMHYANRRDKERTIINGRMWETFDDGSFYFLRGNVTQRKDSTSDARTRITHCNIDRDATGRMVSIRFLSAPDMSPACDNDGVYGIEYDLTHEKDEGAPGRIREQHHLDEKGDRRSDRYGVATIKFGYSGSSLNSIEYLDKARGLVLGRAGFYRSFLQYDGYGNCTNEVLKNKYDKPSYRVLREEDMGREVGGSQIWASCAYVYSNGLRVARHAYQPDGQLLQRKGCVATLRWGYDDWGDCIVRENIGANGHRVINPNGFSVIKCTVDHSTGEITGIRFLMEDGTTPAYDESGVAGFDRIFDECLGLVIEEDYRDGNGQLMANKDGYAMIRQKFDGHGRVVQQVFYDVTTNVCVPAYFGGDIGCVKWEYPRTGGDWQKCLYYTDDTNKVRAKDKYGKSGFVIKYDEYGRDVECWDIGIDDRPLQQEWWYFLYGGRAHKKEYSRVSQRTEIAPHHYAEKGWRVIKTTKYSTDDMKPHLGEGYCSKRQIYDTCGRLMFEIYEDDKGERVMKTTSGYSLMVNKWNEYGMQEECYYFDRFGNPALSARFFDDSSLQDDGIAGWKATYNSTTHELESKVYLGLDQKTPKCLGYNTYSEERYFNNGKGMSEISYWHNGKPVKCVKGFHLVRINSDVFGNKLDEWFFDEKMVPCCRSSAKAAGVHHIHYEYDDFRMLTRLCGYNEREELSLLPGLPYSIKEQTYDPMHRQIEERFIGTSTISPSRYSYEETPGVDEDGVSLRRTVYHGSTKTVARLDEYGITNAPCIEGNVGVWQKSTLKDIMGRTTNYCYYAQTGEPIQASMDSNFACVSKSYHADAWKVAQLDWYGVTNEPCVDYNPNVYRQVRFLDRNEHVTNECFFGVSDAPTEDSCGMIRWVHEYDVNGVRVAMKGFDGKGNVTVAKQRLLYVAQMLPDSLLAKQGILKGDILCGIVCGTNDMDFTVGCLADAALWKFHAMLKEGGDMKNEIMFARKSANGGYIILARTFVRGKTKMIYGSGTTFTETSLGVTLAPRAVFKDDCTTLKMALKAHAMANNQNTLKTTSKKSNDNNLRTVWAVGGE